MFKEIKAVFKVSEDTSFIKGEWKRIEAISYLK